jgi:hypothetical protein
MLPTIHDIDQQHGVATFDRLLLQVWRGECTARALTGLGEVGRALLARHAGRTCCSLSVIESRSPPPGERVRPLLSAVYRELAPGMRHQLFVAEGSGFRAALVRGVGLAVSALAPSLLPFKFAGSVEEAAQIIAPDLSPEAGGVAGIIAALAVLRGKLDALTVT